MFAKPKFVLLAFALCAALASTASAGSGSIGFSYGKKTKHGGFSLHVSNAPACTPCPPPRYAPPPRVWVPGHHDTRCEKDWVPGCEQRVWVEPVFELRYDSCGRAFQFCVAGGHWRNVGSPGHYETRNVTVWVPGHWQGYGPGC